MRPYAFILSFVFIVLAGHAQPYHLKIVLDNHPHVSIALGKVRGDRFIFLDSLSSREGLPGVSLTREFTYAFPQDAHPGMYRLILGQTRVAKLMGEPPEQLDLIYNREDIFVETDFNNPEEQRIIHQSEENKAWFAFLKKEKMYRQGLNQLRQQMNHPRNSPSDQNRKRDAYNLAMMERETFIRQSVEEYQHLFASRIMRMYHEPVVDAYLSEEEGHRFYIENYFRNLDFTDQALINTSIYTDKVIHYIQSYGQYGLSREQQEEEFIKAVDVVFSEVRENPAVYEFILDYMVRGFENLQLHKALTHIAKNYGTTHCLTDEKTTLERRLDFHQMVPGSRVPDFTLPDSNGNPVSLSAIVEGPTLLLFWASWCPHCLEVIPELKEWLHTPESTNLKVVTISLDTMATDWWKAVSETGIEAWVNLSDLKGWDGEVTETYNVYATPTLFLIDENLAIRAKPYGIYELKEELER
jgi:peroxiredoxin